MNNLFQITDLLARDEVGWAERYENIRCYCLSSQNSCSR
jgi:hypothetical protein